MGLVSGAAGDSLKAGILAAIAFPLLAVFGAILILRKKKKDALPLAEKE